MNCLILSLRFYSPNSKLSSQEIVLLKDISLFALGASTSETNWTINDPICYPWPAQPEEKSVRDLLFEGIFGERVPDIETSHKYHQILIDLGGPNFKDIVNYNLLNGIAAALHELRARDSATSLVVFCPTRLSDKSHVSAIFLHTIQKKTRRE